MEQYKDYELSSGLSRILIYSKDEAFRLHSSSIGLDHLLLGILRDTKGNAAMTLSRLSISLDDLREKIEKQLAKQPQNQSPQSINDVTLNAESQRILKLTMLEARQAQSALAEPEHLLLAMLRDHDNTVRQMLNAENITYEKVATNLNLRSKFNNRFGFNESEDPGEFLGGEQATGRNDGKTTQQATKPNSDTPIIDNYGIDLTHAAEEGKLDPVVGREKEIERIAQILNRRKKNNPILIGEPGVGKSAIVEGLAQLIAKKQIVHSLQDKRIVALDMASIVAGTQYRGQFEERLRRLIQELREHPEIVLFIDEIHTIIGAGSAPGSLDAANILKPALARGEVQCIGATTVDEYRKTIEKDGALERRFQKILLEPTTAEETLQILKNIKDKYEHHHNVTYTDDALAACVRLTERYINDRALPDKAIDAMDEAGSRIHMVTVAVPQDIVTMEKRIAELKKQKTEAAHEQNYEKAAQLRDDITQLTAQLDALNLAWRNNQEEHRETVDTAAIAEVVSLMSGVPVQSMAQSESIRLKGMREALTAKVINQDQAIAQMVRAITRNRIGLKDPNRPIGTFMFVGPTGVGKTYLVQTLAEYMFGSKDALIRIDMSEYSEKYSTSRLVGAPPGYVGYDEGGQLTEKVRRHPYSIVLLDEIEKAHGDVFNMLLQVMDEGRMTDGNGTTVDFRNTVIIMTSNSGTRQLKDYGIGIGFGTSESNSNSNAENIVRKALQKQFAPEFLNRLDDVIMFQPLDEESAGSIARLEIQKLAARIEQIGYHLELTDDALRFIVSKGFDKQYGARSLKRAIQTYVEDPICEVLMESTDETSPKGRLRLAPDGDKLSVTIVAEE